MTILYYIFSFLVIKICLEKKISILHNFKIKKLCKML